MLCGRVTLWNLDSSTPASLRANSQFRLSGYVRREGIVWAGVCAWASAATAPAPTRKERRSMNASCRTHHGTAKTADFRDRPGNQHRPPITMPLPRVGVLVVGAAHVDELIDDASPRCPSVSRRSFRGAWRRCDRAGAGPLIASCTASASAERTATIALGNNPPKTTNNRPAVRIHRSRGRASAITVNPCAAYPGTSVRTSARSSPRSWPSRWQQQPGERV